MKALFLSYAYPPLRFPRAIQVAHLVRHSHLANLCVIAADDPDAPQDDDLLRVGGDAPTLRVRWSMRARAFHLLRRATLKERYLAPDLFRPWVRDATREILRRSLVGRGDVIVSFGQPMSDHLAAGIVRRRTGAAWIAHLSDPWIDNPLIRRGRLAGAVTARQERQTMRDAQALVFTSERTAQLVMRKYPATWREKAVVIPHCFDPALYPPLESGDGGEAKLVVRYVGNFYRGRGPDPLFAALSLLSAENPGSLRDVRFELVGSSETGPLVSSVARSLPPDLVTVSGPTSYLKALELMRSADLLLLIDAPGTESVFLPSKLVEYLGAARPIVALTPPGESADLVREAGGWCASPSDVPAVAAAIASALGAARERKRGSTWGDPDLRNRYSATVVASQFDRLVVSAAEG